MAHILVVEDDPAMAEGLAYNLAREGHRVLRAADGPEGLRLALAERPDLVILDVMLPGMDGITFLSRLRAEGSATAVIVLSALGREEDRVRGLLAGADDYVVKPFSLAELLARVRLRLGERAGGPQRRFTVAGGTADLDHLEFRRGADVAALTPTEAALLAALHGRAGAPVSREDLLREVWGVADAGTRTLDTHVARLRRKLEPSPRRPRYLVTVHSVGYRLVS